VSDILQPIAPILLSLGSALSARERHDEAIKVLQNALAEKEAHKPVGQIATLLVDELLIQGDREGALKAFFEWAPVAPADVLTKLDKLTALLRPALLKGPAKQLIETDWMPLLADARTPAADRNDLLKFLVRAHLKIKEPQRAAALLEGNAGLVSNNAELLVLLGDCYVDMHAPDAAEETFLRAESASDSAALLSEINVRLAGVYDQKGLPDKALQRIGIARNHGATGSQLAAIESMSRLRMGDVDGAQAALAAAPDSADVAQARTYLLLAQHKYDEARDVADKILAKHPYDKGVSLLRVQAVAEAGEDLEEIEGRLTRIVERLEPDELRRNLQRTTALRSTNDPALQYFLGLVHRAMNEPEEALGRVDAALQLLAEDTDVPVRVEACARRLRAHLIEHDRPDDAASDFERVAELVYDQGDADLCIQLIKHAATLRELAPYSRWLLADALTMKSYAPDAPKGVAIEPLHEAVAVWEEAVKLAPPAPEVAWAYITRARMKLQLALVNLEQHTPLVAEALVSCEGFYVYGANTAYFQALTLGNRLFGLYGLSVDLLGTAAIPAGDPEAAMYPTAVSDTSTAAANAGNLARMESLLPIAIQKDDPTAHLLETARFHILRRDPRAAQPYIDEAEGIAGLSSYLLWLRIKCLWMLGDRDGLDATLGLGADVAGRRGQDVLNAWDAWIFLLAGDAEKAHDLFAGFSHEWSVLTDPSAEVAFSRLAANRPQPDDETELLRYVDRTRSFEDIMSIELMAGVIAHRYSHTEAAMSRLAATAKDALAERRWPLEADADLDYLFAIPADRPESVWAHTAALAGRARVAIARRDWAAAIAAYNALIPLSERFPQLEQALSWLASELRSDASADSAVVSELQQTVTAFRERGHPRAASWPPEASLGDIWLARDQLEQAAELYRSVEQSQVVGEVRPYWLTRLSLLSALAGRADSDDLLGDAIRAHRDAGSVPSAEIYETSINLVRSEEGWRRLGAAWRHAAQTAPSDIAAEIEASLPLARHGLAALLAEQDDQLPAAAEEFRAAVAASEELHGADDPQTLLSRYELASVLYRQGLWDAAESEYRAVLAARERSDGAESPGALGARYQLALTLAASERLAEAEDEFRTVLERERRVQGAEDPSTLTTQYQLADVLRRQYQLESAESEFRSVLAARERSGGPASPGALIARYQLASTLARGERLDEAEAEFRTVLERERQVQGAEDPSTLITQSQLADVLRERGELEAAESQYRAVLAARERVLGADHRDTLDTRFALAGVLRSRGELDAAEAEIRLVLAAREQVVGSDADDTLMTRFALGDVLRERGELDAAEAEYRVVLAAREQMLGPDNLDSLDVRFALADVLGERGELDAAESQYRVVLAACERALGPDNLDTLQVRFRLAGVLGERGELDAAESQYRLVLAGRERLEGPETPGALIARYQLALTLAAGGHLADAEAELHTVLERERRLQGPEDPSTLITQYQLAEILRERGELEAAESQYRAVLAARERVLIPDAEDTVMTRSALAGVLRERGELEAAESELRSVLAVRERSDGAESPGALSARYQLALTLATGGRLAEAEAEFRTVLEGERRVHGPEDPSTLITQYQLAEVLCERGELEAAESQYRAVLSARERVLGTDHHDTLDTRFALAGVLYQQRQWQAAETELRSVLAARERLEGPDSLAVLRVRYHLALTMAAAERLAEAEAEFRTVLEGERRVQGAEDPSTLITQHQLADVLRERGELEAAESEMRSVLSARERMLGADHPETLDTRFALASLLRESGKLDAAESEFRLVQEARQQLPDPQNAEIQRG
jgi:tetratricopeptide (TPR) repeat protein